MDFNIVINFDFEAPEGWAQNLTIDDYRELEDERKNYYGPLFAKYRTKKIRDYDQDSGRFVGWRPIQVGIGEPIGYEYIGYFAARTIDSVLSSNILLKRIMK